MKPKREVVERSGRRFVLVPEKAYGRMIDDLDDLADIRAYDRAKSKAQEFVPAGIADRLIEGENPVKVWREYRNLTQAELAKRVGVSKPFLSQIENGVRTASLATMKRLALTLKLDLDDLVD